MLPGLAFAAAMTSANVLNGGNGLPRCWRDADSSFHVILGIERNNLQEGVDRVDVEHNTQSRGVS